MKFKLDENIGCKAEQLPALDAAIARGLDDAKAGRSKPAADVFARLQSRYTVRKG